jgi:hypothetical protein
MRFWYAQRRNDFSRRPETNRRRTHRAVTSAHEELVLEEIDWICAGQVDSSSRPLSNKDSRVFDLKLCAISIITIYRIAEGPEMISPRSPLFDAGGARRRDDTNSLANALLV